MDIHAQERLNRRIALTVAERRNQIELHDRATRLRDEFDDMSVTQAVHMAAIQMGLVQPDDKSETDELDD